MSYEHTEQADDNPAALLRLAAAGRREYAESGGPNTELLEHEASAYEQAARILEGDLWALQAALPGWRWMQIPTSFTERGLYGTDRPDPLRAAVDAYTSNARSEQTSTARADLSRLHAALNALDVPERDDETDRFHEGQRWMLGKVRDALQRIHDSGVSPGVSTWYRVDNGWRQDGWPGGSMFVQDGVMPGWGPDGPGAPLAPDMVVGKAGVPIDAYDAIELLSRRPDHPSRLLAEKARAVADWANDPLPYGSLTREQVAEIAPELVEALYDLLGGGPGDVSDARPASGGEVR